MRNNDNKKNRRGGAPLIILTIVLLVAGILAIFVPVMTHDVDLFLGEQDYEELRQQFSRQSTDTPRNSKVKARIFWFSEAVDVNEEIPTLEEVSPVVSPAPAQTQQAGTNADALQSENSDFIAWLRIPGTSVDYPVVQSDDIDYYLHHTLTGKKSSLGTLFSLTKTDYQSPGANIAIYGHHIKSNESVMFSPLVQYKEQSFYADYETIYLDSLYHAGTYTIFAVLNMRYGDWDPSTAGFANERDFQDFIDRAKTQSLYDTGIEVKVSDKILTLITCDRSFIPVYGRLVVMAVQQ